MFAASSPPLVLPLNPGYVSLIAPIPPQLLCAPPLSSSHPLPPLQILVVRRSAAARAGLLVDLTTEAPEEELAAAQAELAAKEKEEDEAQRAVALANRRKPLEEALVSMGDGGYTLSCTITSCAQSKQAPSWPAISVNTFGRDQTGGRQGRTDASPQSCCLVPRH